MRVSLTSKDRPWESTMSNVLVLEEGVEVPLSIRTLPAFRRWCRSDRFPEHGRIDYLAGRIEVEMSPEDLFTHDVLKGRIHASLLALVDCLRSGRVLIDGARVSVPGAGLSVEPDVLYLANESIAAGRIKLVPGAAGEAGRYLEIEGPPDLVVEIVSDRSVTKDTKVLPGAYYRAGVREYWILDARGKELRFDLLVRGRRGYRPVPPDAKGFRLSEIFSRRFRLLRTKDSLGLWDYSLEAREK